MKKYEELSDEQRMYNLFEGTFTASLVYEKLGEILNLKDEKILIEQYEAIRPEIEALAKVMGIINE